jgi:PhnB protein
MTQINPYLIFNGNCREAMTFYHDSLGGDLVLQTVKDSPMADQWPKAVQKSILHASLTHHHLVLLASDMAPKEGVVHGNAISLSLVCSSEAEINMFFTNLSRDGKVTHPLHRFFAGTIGALTDQYGVNWLFKL